MKLGPVFRTVRAQTLLAVALLVVAAVSSVVIVNLRREQRRIVESKKDEARSFAAALAGMSVVDLVEHNWGNVEWSLDYATSKNDEFVYAMLVDASVGNRVVAAAPAELDMSFVPDVVKKEVTEAALAELTDDRTQETLLIRDVTFPGGRLRGREGERIVEVDRALLNQRRERIGTLRIGVSLREIDVATRQALETGVLTGASALFVALVVAYILATRLTRPIEALSARMRVVGTGELAGEVAVRGDDEIADLGRAFNAMLTGLRQKRVLEKYVPKGARDDIEKHKDSAAVQLGGARVRKAILFSDLRGFTSLSERMEPDQVVRLLNAYLERMTRVILASGGDINEYIGDAILAVFVDPSAAVTAAIDMQEALEAQRAVTEDEDVRALRMGIGIHVGVIVEGNIGTQERVKFSVVGDTVNVAARIQDKSRDGKHTCILVSAAVEEETKAAFEYALVGDLPMKGKAEPVRVFEVVKKT